MRTPSCAISADSILRTTCLGGMSVCASTWISEISPWGVTTMLADSTPVSPAIRFSARLTPHGSGTGTASGIRSRGSSPPACIGLDGIWLALPRHHAIAPRGLGAVQRSIGRHQHVLVIVFPRRELGHADTHRHQRRRIALRQSMRLDPAAHLLRHAARAVDPGAVQQYYEFIAAVARREVGGADHQADFPRRALQYFVALLVPVAVVDLLEVVEVHEQHGEHVAAALGPRHFVRQPVSQYSKTRQSRQ